ncbi:MAG: hypothetical protein OSB69_01325 [Alphaproteobacteria bacterium]|nr:hypothetical protein [Alphaproteobacteria bacterium]
MTGDNQWDDELDAETRSGLRILADSTKAKGSEGAARRLFKAADTGSAADYQQAEALFDSLPPEKRSAIQSTAETKATAVRETQIRREKGPPAKPATASAEFIEWELPPLQNPEGVFQARPLEPAKHPAAPRADSTGQAWELGQMPGNPKPSRQHNADRDEVSQNWDWQKMPEAPVLNVGQKKNSALKSELDALREEMLRTLKD